MHMQTCAQFVRLLVGLELMVNIALAKASAAHDMLIASVQPQIGRRCVYQVTF